MTPPKKLKTYPKIHAITYSIIFIWAMYITIKGAPHFWIFAIIIGLILVYWIYKALKEWKKK